nr:P1 family peptidase [Propionibacteriales bacterium]
VLNGNGEMTGLAWVNESGTLTSPVGLTNTHSVGVVRDTLVAIEVESRTQAGEHWSLPVVGETWDGLLNDCDGFHVHPAHVRTAYEVATDGPVEQGNVGGGTGMVCHGFKGGIGTASRRSGDYTVGVLVQANHGRRDRLSINGAPVGRHLDETEVPLPSPPGTRPYLQARGSIICVVATDAPLLPHQCNRMAQRASLGVARTGGAGENSSGDLFLAFATGNRLSTEPAEATGAAASGVRGISMLPDALIDPLFYAAIEATEQAIVNALSAAQTMTGRDGITAVRLPPDRLREILDRHESYDHRR